MDGIENDEWRGFLCACSLKFVNEGSYRSHVNIDHIFLREYLQMFSEYNLLADRDLRLLGPIQKRPDHLLIDTIEQ